jgi:hypothetical protein
MQFFDLLQKPSVVSFYIMSHFNAQKVIVIGGTGGPNSLEKTLFGNPERVDRGHFVRKSVSQAPGTNNEGFGIPNVLCENCTSVFSEDGDWGDDKRHPSREHYTFPGVVKSAESGCHLCVMLLNHISTKSYELLESKEKEGSEQPKLKMRVRRREFVTDGDANTQYCVDLVGFDLENYVPYGYKSNFGGFSTEVIFERQKLEGKFSAPR